MLGTAAPRPQSGGARLLELEARSGQPGPARVCPDSDALRRRRLCHGAPSAGAGLRAAERRNVVAKWLGTHSSEEFTQATRSSLKWVGWSDSELTKATRSSLKWLGARSCDPKLSHLIGQGPSGPSACRGRPVAARRTSDRGCAAGAVRLRGEGHSLHSPAEDGCRGLCWKSAGRRNRATVGARDLWCGATAGPGMNWGHPCVPWIVGMRPPAVWQLQRVHKGRIIREWSTGSQSLEIWNLMLIMNTNIYIIQVCVFWLTNGAWRAICWSKSFFQFFIQRREKNGKNLKNVLKIHSSEETVWIVCAKNAVTSSNRNNHARVQSCTK